MSSTFPQAFYLSDSSVHLYTDESLDDIERDPRGLLLMFEEPNPKAHYIMGLDPTEGITGWNRGTRTESDHKTDNAAIEVFKVDGLKEPVWEDVNGTKVHAIDPVSKQFLWVYRDVQVAEFAAPCDAVEAARVANIVGRIFCGDSEDQCELIWEAWPGPGILTTQELIRLGYTNLWHWEYIDSAAEETNRLGWRSTRESQKLLWYRSRRHLMNRGAIIRSKHLLAEYANAEIDMDKMRARAAYGYHDDRFQAANMCFWGGHKWAYDVERSEEQVTTSPVIDFQHYAPTLDNKLSYREWVEGSVADWED